ncbi:MAG: hypothetical protein V2A55_00380 [Candidatus Jorgensenbacteria bacterium]
MEGTMLVLQVLCVLIPVIVTVVWAQVDFSRHFPGYAPPLFARDISRKQAGVNARLVDLFVEMLAHFKVEDLVGRDPASRLSWATAMAKKKALATWKAAIRWGFVTARNPFRHYKEISRVWPMEPVSADFVGLARRIKQLKVEFRVKEVVV